MTPILEVRNLTHRFEDDGYGFKEVNLTLREGDFTALAGANGSGKTLLMKHLNGLIYPTRGEVLFEGKNIQKNLSQVRRRIGLVFQNPDHQIVSPLVEEEVAFGLRNMGFPPKEIREKTQNILSRVGLTGFEKRQTFTLSGGEKKRLTIASILVMDPRIIVLDEPFTGLDWEGVSSILECLKGLHREGHTILLISHDLEKFLGLTNRLILMNKGQITFDGPPAKGLSHLEKMAIHPPFGWENRPLENLTWLR